MLELCFQHHIPVHAPHVVLTSSYHGERFMNEHELNLDELFSVERIERELDELAALSTGSSDSHPDASSEVTFLIVQIMASCFDEVLADLPHHRASSERREHCGKSSELITFLQHCRQQARAILQKLLSQKSAATGHLSTEVLITRITDWECITNLLDTLILKLVEQRS
jgi:hypothetical protein